MGVPRQQWSMKAYFNESQVSLPHSPILFPSLGSIFILKSHNKHQDKKKIKMNISLQIFVVKEEIIGVFNIGSF